MKLFGNGMNAGLNVLAVGETMGILVEREAPTINFLKVGKEEEMAFPPFFCSNFLCFEARVLAKKESLISLREDRVVGGDKGEDGDVVGFDVG